ncbi:MAG: hypothetical protein AVDCRST_MAG11-3169, partial [uncultured Gemmatimonadaceae bacterium]
MGSSVARPALLALGRRPDAGPSDEPPATVGAVRARTAERLAAG